MMAADSITVRHVISKIPKNQWYVVQGQGHAFLLLEARSAAVRWLASSSGWAGRIRIGRRSADCGGRIEANG
ncbi:hypothetical protein [Rhizobium ruizarguesonis]|uniref:hypothetical protein n=1 Tax=Rhizobium ruizarguesonis TaxID=2081791 RepID=UPI003CCEFEC6